MKAWARLAEIRAIWRARKHLKEMLHSADTVKAMREDLLGHADRAELARLMAEARRGVRRGSKAEADALAEALSALLNRVSPVRPCSAWRGNFEVVVIALSVAMAFRAYFYQPFKIPTGSMYPTLSGIASYEQAAPGLWDRMPLKLVNWLVTGDWYKEVRVKTGGLASRVKNDEARPGYAALQIAGERYYVPSDALLRRGSLHLNDEDRIASGAVLWSGIVTDGDFVFVNRWLWNFRRPRRGEVMVFSTERIRGLTPGTHYIKRMCGLPGETLSIRPPQLFIDGSPVSEPALIGIISRCGKLAEWAPNYAGFSVPGGRDTLHPKSLTMAGDSVSLADDEYYALGDNSRNSLDSRFWGPVPERNLVGPATVVYWPFTSKRFGRIR
jgi:signal peptidase I